MYRFLFCIFIFTSYSSQHSLSQDSEFKGMVSSASPEATDIGVEILEQGGNAFDVAVAVSLALGASEPAGSGVFGQTVMLVQPAGGEPFVIQGSTLSPANIPSSVTRTQLVNGRTATTIPSNLKVLSFTHQNYGSGNLTWQELLNPTVELYKNGFTVGPFRHRAFDHYGVGKPEDMEYFAQIYEKEFVS